MSQHACSGGGGEMMNLSGGDPFAGEVLWVECDMGLEMMLDRNKDGSVWRVAWREEELQIRSKGRYRQMVPSNSLTSIQIRWFESVVSCLAVCPLIHLETWLLLPQPWSYSSLIPGTTSIGSLAAIPMALSVQGFPPPSPPWVLLGQRVAQSILVLPAEGALENSCLELQKLSQPHTSVLLGRMLLTSFTHNLGAPVCIPVVQIPLLLLHFPYSFIPAGSIFSLVTQFCLMASHSPPPAQDGILAGLV